MYPLSSSPNMARPLGSSRMETVCKRSQRCCSIRCDLNQRGLKKTGTRKVSCQSFPVEEDALRSAYSALCSEKLQAFSTSLLTKIASATTASKVTWADV